MLKLAARFQTIEQEDAAVAMVLFTYQPSHAIRNDVDVGSELRQLTSRPCIATVT
jgi:hypothetical protein